MDKFHTTNFFCEMRLGMRGKNTRGLLSGDFLSLSFNGGDGFCAAFGGIFVGKHNVHEYGTRDHGVHMLRKHLGLFSVADAETTENFGAVLTDRVDKVERRLVNGGFASGSASAECSVDVLETCGCHRFEAFLGHAGCGHRDVFETVPSPCFLQASVRPSSWSNGRSGMMQAETPASLHILTKFSTPGVKAREP